MSCMCNGNDNNTNANNINGAECSRFFPQTIKGALARLVCECVVITLRNGCKEKVRIECISGNLLVAKEGGCLFRFIDIDCICAVTAECYDVLEGILNK